MPEEAKQGVTILRQGITIDVVAYMHLPSCGARRISIPVDVSKLEDPNAFLAQVKEMNDFINSLKLKGDIWANAWQIRENV